MKKSIAFLLMTSLLSSLPSIAIPSPKVISKLKPLIKETSLVQKAIKGGKLKAKNISKAVPQENKLVKLVSYSLFGTGVTLLGYHVIQGDILVPPFGTGINSLWPNKIIPYDAHEMSESMRLSIQKQMKTWQDATGIQFVEKTQCKKASHYLYFKYLDQDNPFAGVSFIGRQMRKQVIGLKNNASDGTILHELGHAIGFDHEQNRQDRDQYITVYPERIDPSCKHNFTMNTNPPLQVPYDFDSIMHYSSFHCSADGLPVMTKKDGTLIYGKSYHHEASLSEKDIQRVVLLYASKNKFLTKLRNQLNHECNIPAKSTK